MGAGFLGAVQHGDFPDRSGEGLDEFGGVLRAEGDGLFHERVEARFQRLSPEREMGDRGRGDYHRVHAAFCEHLVDVLENFYP